MADNANDDRKQDVSLEDINARARAEGTTRAKIQQQIASGAHKEKHMFQVWCAG